jgi:hypothetical protein
LTLAERDFWRPHWQRPGDLPPYLQLVEANGYFVLYERVEIEPSHAFQPPEP